MSNDIIYYCWFKWEIKLIKADHDGYCTDSNNIEETYYFNRYYQYELNADEYYTLIWLNNECSKMYQNENFIEAIKPKSIKTPIDHDGSDYCSYSIINSLSHEKLKIPIKIIDFNIDNTPTKRKKYIVNSSKLKKLLLRIININNVINKIFNKIFPMEVIDIILKKLWNKYFI